MAPKKRAGAKKPAKKASANGVKKARALNAKQRLFIAEYCRDFNATQAAIRAGYSERSAYSIGHDLLKKPEIRAAIAETQEALLKEAGVDAFRVLRELARIAFGDLRRLATWDANGVASFTPSDELTDDDAAALSELTYTLTLVPQKNAEPIERHQTKIKRYNKMDALKVLVEHLNLTNGNGPGSSEKKANPLAALVDAIARSKERQAKEQTAQPRPEGG